MGKSVHYALFLGKSTDTMKTRTDSEVEELERIIKTITMKEEEQERNQTCGITLKGGI